MRVRLALALAACALGLAATAPPDPATDPAQEQLRRLRREVERLTAERERLAQEQEGVLLRLEQSAAEARLLDARVEELSLLERRAGEVLAQAREREEQAALQLDQQRERLRATVLLLQQAGPFGWWRPLLGSAQGRQLAAGLRAAHELTARRREDVTQLAAQVRELQRLRVAREAQEREAVRLRSEAAEARAGLERAMAVRQRLLASLREQSQVRTAAIEELGRAGRRLEEIVAGARAPEPVELDIHRFRGVLPMPVRGQLARGFGDRVDPQFNVRLPHPGWDVEARFGAPVRAPFAGRVVWAEWLRGYGLVVVVDHGGGVSTVYAHLSAVLARSGTRVARGQQLGSVGDTGSLRGAYLYLEVRLDGKAQDPAAWFDQDRLVEP
ncbi:MAG: peptidoglycan DD-metalloendopeptidase family protein [Acidobacteria bacterium]|nr:peptidoglycan DD-metalloendopeptidase family protein [Acidobacteriota bacterium]